MTVQNDGRGARDEVENAARILEAGFGVVREVEPYQTWGRTVVVAGLVGDDRTPVVLNATAERDVLAEAATLRLVREAGVPAPRLLEVGEARALPGGRWIVMERAGGQRLAQVAEHDQDSALRSLAAGMSRLHGIERPGSGWLNPAGVGRFDSWSNWLRPELKRLYTHPQHVVRADHCYSLYQAHNAIRNAAWSAVNAAEWVHDLVDFATAEAARANTAD